MAVNGSRMYVVKRGKFRFARQAVHIKRNGALLGISARLKEIGTRWNKRCFIFQCVPIFFKGRSFTSVFIFVPSWYALIWIEKCTLFGIKFHFEKWWGWSLGRGQGSIIKYKKIHAFLLNRRHFILMKNAKRMLTKWSSPESHIIRYVIPITGLCIFYWYQFRSGVLACQFCGLHKHQICGGNMVQNCVKLPHLVPWGSGHMDGAVLLATTWSR